jgi:hypothetical protein
VIPRQTTVILEQLALISEQNALIKWQKRPFSSRMGLGVFKKKQG